MENEKGVRSQVLWLAYEGRVIHLYCLAVDHSPKLVSQYGVLNGGYLYQVNPIERILGY